MFVALDSTYPRISCRELSNGDASAASNPLQQSNYWSSLPSYLPALSNCSSSSSSSNNSSGSDAGSSGNDENCCFTESFEQIPTTCNTLNLDREEPLTFYSLSTGFKSPGAAMHRTTCPTTSPLVVQRLTFQNMLPGTRQHGFFRIKNCDDADSSFLQAEDAGCSGQEDALDSQFTQPLLWMSHSCHWMRDTASLVALPGRQQLELAGQFVRPSLTPPCFLEYVAAAAQCRTAANFAGCQQALDVHQKLQQSEDTCSAAVRALMCKTRECENLAAIVRELATSRAQGAGAKIALQEKCSLLVADVAKLHHVAAVARTGQLASMKALQTANESKAKAEGIIAYLVRHQVSNGEAHEDTTARLAQESSPFCTSSKRPVVSSAAISIAGSMPRASMLPRMGVSC